LRSAFAQNAERSEGELSITTLPTFASKWLVHRLGTFQLQNPKLAVRLDTSIALADLTTGEFDVSIRAGKGTWPGMITHFLLPNLYTPLVSPKLLKTLGPRPTPRDLATLPLLGRTDWWLNWLTEAGATDVDLSGRRELALYVEEFDVKSALAGHGVAIASPIFFGRELESGSLVNPFPPVLRDPLDYWVTYPEFRQRSEKIRTFVQWILAEAKPEASPKGARRATRT